MRTSFTAVIEQDRTHRAAFATEPYECAWAGEARWFVRAISMSEGTTSFAFHPEISPDGLFWCDEGSPPLVLSGEGMVSLPLRNFGGWLRLRVEVDGEEPEARLMIQLALKA